MPCLAVLIALFAPRLTMILLWLFTRWFAGIFDSILWPILGFFFLPTTTLWYTAVHNWWGGEWGGLQIVGLIVAVLIDGSPASGRKKKK